MTSKYIQLYDEQRQQDLTYSKRILKDNAVTCELIMWVEACAGTVLTPLTLLTLGKLSAPYDPTSEELIKTPQLPQSSCEA